MKSEFKIEIWILGLCLLCNEMLKSNRNVNVAIEWQAHFSKSFTLHGNLSLTKLILLPWSKQGIVDQPNNFSTFYSKCICILIPTLIQCKIFGMKGINPMVLQLVECEFSRFLYIHKSGFVETINVLWNHGHEKCLKLKRHFHPSGYVTDIIWMRK